MKLTKRKAFAGKAIAILLGGCLLQLGGCGSFGGLGGGLGGGFGALIGLAASPLLLQAFGGLFGGGTQ